MSGSLRRPGQMPYVRTQLTPKGEGVIETSEMRPLSIMSVWYRLCSRALLTKHMPLLDSLHARLCGGIPGRTLYPLLPSGRCKLKLPLMLAPLPLMAPPPRSAFCPWMPSNERLGISGSLSNDLRLIGGFYLGLQRVLAYAGHQDIVSFHPGVGIPQGLRSECLFLQHADGLLDSQPW